MVCNLHQARPLVLSRHARRAYRIILDVRAALGRHRGLIGRLGCLVELRIDLDLPLRAVPCVQGPHQLLL